MNRFITRLRNGVGVATLAAGAVTMTAQGAWAAPGPASAPEHSVLIGTTSMHLATAVRVVGSPDASGAVPVLLTDGSTVPIRADLLDRVLHPTAVSGSGGIQPYITVYGSCGSSNIYLHEKSDGHPVRMTTGFTIYSYLAPAVYYKWRAEIHRYNGGYDYYYQASGGLLFRYSWSGAHNSVADYPRGYYYAAVDYGVATLSNGLLCVSGNPYAPLTYL
jgi:hypothetical protein